MPKLDLKNYKNRHSLKSKVARVAWNVVWLLFFRLTPRGNLFRPWRVFLLKCFGAKVSWRANVLPSAKIWAPWNLCIGDFSSIDSAVECYSVDFVEVGTNATVSRRVFLCTASHDISSPTMELVTKPIVIKDNAWVCARAIILPGVTIGEGAVVAAGAVVTKDVAPWTVVGGNPAKVIAKRELRGE